MKVTRFLYSQRFEFIVTSLSKHIFKFYLFMVLKIVMVCRRLLFLTQGYFLVQGSKKANIDVQ